MIVLIIQNIQNPKLLAYFKQNSFQRGIWYLGCSDRVPMLKHTAQQVKHYNKTKCTDEPCLTIKLGSPNTKGNRQTCTAIIPIQP